MEEVVKKFNIKYKTSLRLRKEITSYEQEADIQRGRINSLIDSQADEYDVRKQNEVLEETLRMIPDTRYRYQSSLTDFSAFINEYRGDLENSQVSLTEVDALFCEINES